MEANLKSWNMPGVGVGIVKNGELVFVKGYGYSDYEKKTPITANTLFQIASNTKLFTATAIGLLVNEGKLDWDKPIKTFVPSIQFYNNELNSTITIRDMLSHRTGVTRHDLIWYKSDFNRTELFDKLKHLEPVQPLRQGFLYNNLMYAASGHIISLVEGKTWETYVQEKILNPLKMTNTYFNITDMKKQSDYFVPYNEKRDTNILYKTDYDSETDALGPAGSIVSNLTDLSHWLAALMNKGVYEGKQVLPESVVSATMEPSIALPNTSLAQGYTEILNPVYGMGRQSVSYRGHQLVLHGGDLNGIHSQISYMPQDGIGVIVFVIGDHSLRYNSIIYNVYEHLLGLSITPWSERGLKNRNASKKVGKEGREKAMQGQVKGTTPSHKLSDYLGDFENNAYGIINVEQKDTQMVFTLHNIHLPMNHFHYDRFDTNNDEEKGFYSLNYQTNPQGEIDRFIVSLDEGEVTFVKKTATNLSTIETLTKYAGKYKIGTNAINVVLKNKNHLFISGAPDTELIPYKEHIFKTKEFADATFEFVIKDGVVTAMKQKDGTGEYEIKRSEEN
ncbi:serine hydrolase [Flavobacterium sp. XS2P39]|uniref:serine hydrolase n=1 Tax=Flavobacterium sp. XS2P39 TaxID=3401725 RepID=UPI003AABEDC9